jgi:putative acetyltransferase
MDFPQLRYEQPSDAQAVYAVNQAAFDGQAESNLVVELHRQSAVIISLVAELGGQMVGHILFSPVSVSQTAGNVRVAGLAPLAVLPKFQNQGIGSALVRRGLESCREQGYAVVVVLGHPDYYPRFGFTPAQQHGLSCEYDAPPEAFMALELEPGALDQVSGLVRFHPAFKDV